MHQKIQRIRAILCALSLNNSFGEIERRHNVSKSTVKRHLDCALAAGLDIRQIHKMPDETLREVFYPGRSKVRQMQRPDWSLVYLRRSCPVKKETLRDIHAQYAAACRKDKPKLSYSTFCDHYARFVRQVPASMKEISISFSLTPGKSAVVGFVSENLLYRSVSNKRTSAYLFAALLPDSGYLYFHAVGDQTRETALECCSHAFAHFKGRPHYVCVRDGSSLLTQSADKTVHNPRPSPPFFAMAKHYGIRIRILKKNDEPEQILWNLALKRALSSIRRELENRQFVDLAEVNDAVRKAAQELNAQPIHPGWISRTELFEMTMHALSMLPDIAFSSDVCKKTLCVRQTGHVRYANKRIAVPEQYKGSLVQLFHYTSLGRVDIHNPKTGEVIVSHKLEPEDAGDFDENE